MAMDVQAAIDFLIDSSGEAIVQIEELEAKLQRLKRARQVLAKANGEHVAAKRRTAQPKPEKSQNKLAYWSELEQKIFDAVSKSTDKVTCSSIGDMLGLSYTTVGKAVSTSERLEKQGSYIVVIA